MDSWSGNGLIEEKRSTTLPLQGTSKVNVLDFEEVCIEAENKEATFFVVCRNRLAPFIPHKGENDGHAAVLPAVDIFSCPALQMSFVYLED